MLELIAQANNDAYAAGRAVGIILAVIISASIPISYGSQKQQFGLGLMGAIFAGIAALFLGCLGGIPIALIFVVVISAVSNESGSSRNRRRRRRTRDYDDDYDDEPAPRRSRKPKKREPEEDDDEDDDRERQRRMRW